MGIASLRPELTRADIERLMRGETPEARATVAHRLCRRIALDVLTSDERAYAEEIMSILAQDAAELVRRTLAVALRNSPRLPRETALELARDVESVALPVLEHSPSFTEQDLIEIVLACGEPKQAAVASRAEVPLSLSDVIAEHCGVDAVRALAANPGADLSGKALDVSLDRFDADEPLHQAIINRDQVPSHIAEKMVALVSGSLFDVLVKRHQLPAQLAIDLAGGARERATIDLVDQAGRTSDVARFVAQLNLNARLTHSLILRALCVGHMSFVEHALAELSGVPHSRVWLMVHDAGALGLQAVFDRAGLPRRYLPVFKTAVAVFHETQLDGGPDDRIRFRSRMIERVLTQYQALPSDDLEYLLDKLDAYADHTQDDGAAHDAA